MDPQRNLNKREIQKTSYIDHAINSPIMFYYEDYDAKKTFEEEGNKPGSTIMYRNTVAPPKRMQPANVNSDVWNDIADSRDKMNDISGINDTARGQSEYSNESARLFSMKAERTWCYDQSILQESIQEPQDGGGIFPGNLSLRFILSRTEP